MPELMRTIVKEDVLEIKKVLNIVEKNNNEIKVIERLGGMTNRSYRVVLANKEELAVRIPGEGTEKLINRMDERKSNELACLLGIDSELLYFGNDGTKVMRFIHNPQPMNEDVMRKVSNIHKAAEIFFKLHTSGVDTGVCFDIFEKAALYEDIINEANVPFFDDYYTVKNYIMSIKAEIDKKFEIAKVPCHNDSLVGNWVLGEDNHLYLIDWEYSGMNEAMWDLACLSIEADFSPEEDEELLRAYYALGKEEVGLEKRQYFIASKMYVDYLWTLWGLTRVPYDGDFMTKYAQARYERLKKNIGEFKKVL